MNGRIALLTTLLLTGCLNPVENKVDPNAPVELHPMAHTLAGVPVEAVVAAADRTAEPEPFDTTLLRRVADRVGPAVVSIYTRTSSKHTVNLLPIQPPWGGVKVGVPGQALGSGFFIHPSGFILTNEHVLRDATEIRIMTLTGADLGADVVAVDPVYDLALLRVTAPGTYPALPMGDSGTAAAGDWVIAVGNPLGLGHTVTLGIVSQVGRNLTGLDADTGRPVEYLQVDAAINPGSSGGPLITLAGTWIGVNSAGIPGAQNIGFSVPSQQVREFLENVIAGEGVWVGAE